MTRWILTGLLAACAGQAWSAPLELLPNIRALPAADFSVGLDVIGRPVLRFSTTTWNMGQGPLEVIAGETGTSRRGDNRQNIYQRIFLDDGTSYQRLAGSFIWHPDHHHFHMNEYAVYSLQKVGAKGKSKLTGAKTSFCLIDSDAIDLGIAGAPATAQYQGCNNDFQGISVGWGDLYGAHLPGQSLELTGLDAGDYMLRIEADSKDRLRESNEDDNESCVLLHLDPAALIVTVLNPAGCDESPPPGGDVTINGIAPTAAAPGSATPVTITGSGFTANANVSFENGAGKRPIASDVLVVDTQTITAVVTVGKGAKQGTWDLRVDSAVLTDAFAVQ